ncbi:maleylacetate reductase [Rhizobium leguminosarum]|uniref:maleylacetate reductase n=1 Tax=Rhizobium leguminosarum TaxID=384 RepID=UPI00048B1C5C|nr:maleylacetate reductase [Rhizobium leguminosarum]UIJ83204.1 maleylacetate reductase [Rhizobium leguminosarum]
MKPFLYTPLPTRVVFGRGKISEAPNELRKLGISKPIIVTTPQQRDAGETLAHSTNGVAYPHAEMHTPVRVTSAAIDFVSKNGIDGIVALGGGSSTGLGKAIAFRTDLPQLVIPTSYAGSEMTNILGETEDDEKKTKRDARIQPEAVIYDPDLLATLPSGFAATSGLNAMAHAVEALYASDGNPVVWLMAEEGIRAMAEALPKRNGGHDEALYGAWLCGTVLGSCSMGFHHKLCHVLGGSFNLPHAETHAIILPHAAAYNAPATRAAMTRIAVALGASDAPRGLFELSNSLGVATALKDIGMAESDLAKAADIAAATPYPNPRPLERGAIVSLLQDAFFGRPPPQTSH